MAKEGNKSAEMSDLIKLWRTSGVSKKQFCIDHQINIHTFTYWIGKEGVLESPVGFMEINSQKSSSYVELYFPQGAVLRLSSEVSMTQISLIKTLLY